MKKQSLFRLQPVDVGTYVYSGIQIQISSSPLLSA